MGDWVMGGTPATSMADPVTSDGVLPSLLTLVNVRSSLLLTQDDQVMVNSEWRLLISPNMKEEEV